MLKVKKQGIRRKPMRILLLTAIICIRDANTTTDDTSPLERSIIALIACMHNRLGIHKAVANDTFTIALFA